MFPSGSIFSKPFESQATVAPSAVVTPWYLLGGVTAAQCVAAYQPKDAADLAASYVNLNNPGTYNAAPGTAPTLNNGWVFNGSSQYLKTGVIFGSNYTVIIRIDAYTSAAGRITGAVNGGNVFFIGNNIAGARQYRYGVNSKTASGSFVGVVGIAGANAYYYSGSLTTDTTALDNTAMTTYDLYIGATNNGGTAGTFCNPTIAAYAIYNIALSSTVFTIIAAAMAAL